MRIVYCMMDCSRLGGMERVICCKANYLADIFKYEVIIITTDQRTKKTFYEFSNKIKFIDLGIDYYELNQYRFFKRIYFQIKKRYKHKAALKKILCQIKADIVISTYTHEFTLLPDIHDSSKKIGEIHFSKEYNRIKNKRHDLSFLSKITSIIAEKRKHLYIDKYEKFVTLTKNDMKNWESRPNVVQIYNMLPFSVEKLSSLETKRVISVGRLSFEKGFDLLIEAWTIVSIDFPDWKLDIFGSGEEYDKLTSLIQQKGLSNSIKINVPSQNISDEYLNSSICVMSSRYEGFGMVLIEAMSCGVPCISFDCPQGPSEILAENKDGLLVENGNINELAKKIKLLISNENLRKKMGEQAKFSAMRFSPTIIMNNWNNLFLSLQKS